MADINLIPKDQISRRTATNWSTRALLLVIIIVAAAIGGMFIYKLVLTNKQVNLGEQIAKVQQEKEQYTTVSEEADLLQRQLLNLQGLLDNHTYWSELFWQLNDSTLKEVTLVSLGGEMPGVVNLTASTTDYTAVAKQIVAYMSNPFFSDYSIDSAGLLAGAEGRTAVEFNLDLQLADNSLYKTDKQVEEDSLRTIIIPEEVVEEATEEETAAAEEAVEEGVDPNFNTEE